MAILTNDAMELSRGTKVRVTSHSPTANVMITMDNGESYSTLHMACAEAERLRDMLTVACAAMKPAAKMETPA